MDADERTRLLPDQPDQGLGDVPVTTTSSRPETRTAFPRRHLIYCFLIFIVSFLVVSSAYLQVIPLFDLLMRNICHRLRPELDPSSPECFFGGDIEHELVLVTGWSYVLTILPGILTVVPYGYLADQYGRKPGLRLAIVGLVLAQAFNIIVYFWPNVFHHRLTWISPLFMFIGGGSVVLSSLLFTMLSDIAPDAHRTTTFFGLGVAWLAAELVAFPLASTLMHKNIWLPVFVGFSLYIPIIAIALCLPETLHMKALHDDVVDAAPNADEEERDGDIQSHNRPWWTRWWRSFTEGIPRFRAATLSIFWGSRQVTLLLLTLVVTSVGTSAQILLPQYANWRFEWDWLKAGYLVYFKAALSASFLLLLFPAANHLLTIKMGMLPKNRDLLLASISCILLAVGNLVVGLAPTSCLMLVGLSIVCLGYPYNFILRGLLSELVDGHHHGLLFASVALMENLGAALVWPLIRVFFGIGVNLGGMLTGLPFLVAALLFAITMIILRYVRVV